MILLGVFRLICRRIYEKMCAVRCFETGRSCNAFACKQSGGSVYISVDQWDTPDRPI